MDAMGRSMTATTIRRETLTLDLDGTYRLRRLSDGEYADLRRSTIAIERVPFWIEDELRGRTELSLGEFYASMKSLFGERGRLFDQWKCTFSFPLALDVRGVARSPAYILEIKDFRGGIEHNFLQVVSPSDPRLKDPTYYAADPEELSASRMAHLLSHFTGFQKGFYESYPHTQEPFLMVVESNLILYGHNGQRFFEEQPDHKDFDARWRVLSARLPTPGFYRNA